MANMQLCIYSEKMGNNRALGRELGAGDDALPYVGKHLLSIADGAGGRGGERVPNIDPRLTQREHSFRVMMAGCGLKEELYGEYYDKNFKQLCDLGAEDYKRSGGRHSSYFGSRLATLFLRKIIEEDEFPEDSIKEKFEELAGMSDGERERCLSALEERMAARLLELMKRAARNSGIGGGVADSRNPNLNLMCTTYSGICFYEAEDRVHMLSIQAGDSMMWAFETQWHEDSKKQQKLVMRQLLPAQETSGGSLANYIDADAPFYLRCAYHCFLKPCVALAATDGCFDAFPVMPKFERFLMSRLTYASELKKAVGLIQDYYNDTITGDDSASLAMLCFGFESYDALSEMAQRRMGDLTKHYKLDNEQLYSTEDPIEAAVGAAQRDLTRARSKFADELWENSPRLREDATALARRKTPKQFEVIEAQMRSAKEKADRELQAAREQVREKVEYYWMSIRESILDESEPEDAEARNIIEALKRMIANLPDILRKKKDCGREYRNARKELQAKRSELARELRYIRESAKDLMESIPVREEDRTPHGPDRRSADAADRLPYESDEKNLKLTKAISNALGGFGDYKKNLDKLYPAIDGLSHKVDEMRKQTLRDDKALIDAATESFCGNPEAVEQITRLLEPARKDLRALCEQARKVQTELEASAEEDARGAEEAFVRRSYNANLAELLRGCFEHIEDYGLPKELLARIDGETKAEREELEALQEILNQKKGLLDEYQTELEQKMADRR